MVNKLAAVAAAAFIMSLSGCGAAEATEVTAEPANRQIEASPAAETPALTGGMIKGSGYTLELPAEKWMSSDSYVAYLESKGYTFDNSISQLKDDSDGTYYFVDESVKQGMENEQFTYDVPYLVISKPEECEGEGLDGENAEEKEKQIVDDAVELYEHIDGMSVDKEASGIVSIGGRKFVRVTIDNFLAGGEIHLRNMTYQAYESGKLYTFSFSSTDELSEKMLPEYEAVLASFRT